jgi:hypothetical protein
MLQHAFSCCMLLHFFYAAVCFALLHAPCCRMVFAATACFIQLHVSWCRMLFAATACFMHAATCFM